MNEKKKPVGRILILPRGKYDSSFLYEPLDLVTHNGSCWLCKETAKGIEPSDGNSTHWMKLFDFTLVNRLDYEKEGGALDARLGVALKQMIAEKALYETLVLTSREDGAIHIPTKEGYEIYSAFSASDGYTLIGSIGSMYLYTITDGMLGSVAKDKACKVAVTYAKEVS